MSDLFRNEIVGLLMTRLIHTCSSLANRAAILVIGSGPRPSVFSQIASNSSVLPSVGKPVKMLRN